MTIRMSGATRRITRVAVALAMAGAAACVDANRGGARDFAERVDASELSLGEDGGKLTFRLRGQDYSLMQPADIGPDVLGTIGNQIDVMFNKRTTPGERTAIECALTHYGALAELGGYGTASLEGYQLAMCAAGDALQYRFAYLPTGVWQEINDAVAARGGVAAESDAYVVRRGTVVLLGRAVDGGLISVSGMGGMLGYHPIVVEYWASTDRTYDTLASTETYFQVLLQNIELASNLRGLSGR